MLLCAGTRWAEAHRAGVSGLCSDYIEQLIPSLPSMQLLLKIAIRKTQNITEWNSLFRLSTFHSFCNISSDSTEREILFNYTHIHFLIQIFRSCFWTALLVAGLHLRRPHGLWSRPNTYHLTSSWTAKQSRDLSWQEATFLQLAEGHFFAAYSLSSSLGRHKMLTLSSELGRIRR